MKTELEAEGRTPQERRYYTIKAKYPASILLFRCTEEHYEAFGHDAEKLGKVLGVPVTYRESIKQPINAMAGFLVTELESSIRTLIQAGIQVAIFEPLFEPPPKPAPPPPKAKAPQPSFIQLSFLNP
jgi:DNA mismatch repair ATPase MutS